MSGSGLKTLPKSGNGRETLLYVREALSNVLEWSVDTDECPGVVGGPHG